jgi:RNA polymerase sigma factor (sigma-70 family)
MKQDQQWFEEFYAAARDECLQVVLVSVGDRRLAEELVAEAFTRAWMSGPKVRAHPAPRAWVVRTALNQHVSWWRRHRREVRLGSHDAAAAASQDPGLDGSLMAALRQLPVRQREVIVLRLLMDLDTATTAQTLGMPILPGSASTSPGTQASASPRTSTAHKAHLTDWTVVKQADGSVTVIIRELNDIAGLQRKLRAEGVPAKVTLFRHLAPHPFQRLGHCRVVPQDMTIWRKVFSIPYIRRAHSNAIRIHPAALPSGVGVLLGEQVSPTYKSNTGRQLVPTGHYVLLPTFPTLVYTSPRCTGS